MLLLGGGNSITTWRQFARQVRASGQPLLGRLGKFQDAILVAGCQRSGTTMLARVLNATPELVDFRFGRDDELDAALILSGAVHHEPRGRYCFQTTYLNERYVEYAQANSPFRLIWVVRNPYSVVCSLMYNWRRFALNELFENCGADLMDAGSRRRYEWLGTLGVSRLTRACLAYSGKVDQVFDIAASLGERMLVVDYDALVANKDQLLPRVFEFVDVPFKQKYADAIHSASVAKASRLSAHERAAIEQLCVPAYERARALATVR